MGDPAAQKGGSLAGKPITAAVFFGFQRLADPRLATPKRSSMAANGFTRKGDGIQLVPRPQRQRPGHKPIQMVFPNPFEDARCPLIPNLRRPRVMRNASSAQRQSPAAAQPC